jgi:hypothetical protein
MPQVDIQYSSEPNLDLDKICTVVNDTIEELDGPGRDCKIRTHTATASSQPSMFINIGLLEKPYRDAAFQKKLIDSVMKNIAPLINSGASLAVNIYFLNNAYMSAIIS